MQVAADRAALVRRLQAQDRHHHLLFHAHAPPPPPAALVPPPPPPLLAPPRALAPPSPPTPPPPSTSLALAGPVDPVWRDAVLAEVKRRLQPRYEAQALDRAQFKVLARDATQRAGPCPPPGGEDPAAAAARAVAASLAAHGL
jgi:hypothetical protein